MVVYCICGQGGAGGGWFNTTPICGQSRAGGRWFYMVYVVTGQGGAGGGWFYKVNVVREELEADGFIRHMWSGRSWRRIILYCTCGQDGAGGG